MAEAEELQRTKASFACVVGYDRSIELQVSEGRWRFVFNNLQGSTDLPINAKASGNLITGMGGTLADSGLDSVAIVVVDGEVVLIPLIGLHSFILSFQADPNRAISQFAFRRLNFSFTLSKNSSFRVPKDFESLVETKSLTCKVDVLRKRALAANENNYFKYEVTLNKGSSDKLIPGMMFGSADNKQIVVVTKVSENSATGLCRNQDDSLSLRIGDTLSTIQDSWLYYEEFFKLQSIK